MNTIKKNLQKGFTLIELLIVIAVLGVLATVVLVAIDPIDKINAANDSKVQNDIGLIVNAAQAYAVTHDGTYPSVALLVSSGELKSMPTPPTGYGCTSYNYNVSTATPPVLRLYCGLKSKRYTQAQGPAAATPFWVYSGSTGKACATAASADNCP